MPATLPKLLPGKFYLLEWNRLQGKFIIHLDNETHDSYHIGTLEHVEKVVFQLTFYWKIEEEIAKRSIDMAREFHLVQCIWNERRVIPIIQRTPNYPPLFAEENEPVSSWVTGI